MLAYDPETRITAEAALKHEYFSEYTNQADQSMKTQCSNFRSTFFTMKERSEEGDGESVKVILSNNCRQKFYRKTKTMVQSIICRNQNNKLYFLK